MCGLDKAMVILAATGIQSPFPLLPSFSPQRESRALSPIQPDAGLQEWSRWEVDMSTRSVLVGITFLVHDQGSGFPLRRE